MNAACCGHLFLHRGLLEPARSNVPHLPEKKSIPTGGDTSAKQLIFRPIPPNDRHTKEWTAIAWPTNIQSKTPDGKFGPAKQMETWGDCWFLAALAAVANDRVGHAILAESIEKVNDGYNVTFKGSPVAKIFISDVELQELLKTEGGDADTRIIELAADRFFQLRGNFKDTFIAYSLQCGENQSDAERCFQDYCQRYGIQDPIHFNPMRANGNAPIAFFLLTGMVPEFLKRYNPDEIIQKSDVMRFLNRFAVSNRNGISAVIKGSTNPLGDNRLAQNLVIKWDVVRTDIACDERLRKQQRAFLNALIKWLETRNLNNLEALKSAAGRLKLEHIDPAEFVYALAHNQPNMNQDHYNLLQSAVQEVLAGGSGYIGFAGSHCGVIEGINETAGTFTYSEPNFPTVVHTGELSHLIQSIISGKLWLSALEPTTERDEAESSHAGEKRGRHLRETHNQVVGDGKIDPAESGPLANLMEMDDGAFWQVYDSDKNGVIEGGELKAVQLRVDRWVDHFELTLIW